MIKLIKKKALITVFFFLLTLLIYILSPLFLNLNNFKSNFEETIGSNLNTQTSISGDINYKYFPLPSIVIKDIELGEDIETKSRIESTTINIYPHNLLLKKFSISNIAFKNGQFPVKINEINDLKSFDDFKIKIKFRNINIKLIRNDKILVISNSDSKIDIKNSTINKIKLDGVYEEIPFYLFFNKNKLEIKAKEINLKTKIVFDQNINKVIFSYDDKSLFPGLENILVKGKFTNQNKTLIFKNANISSKLINGKFDFEYQYGSYHLPKLKLNLDTTRIDKIQAEKLVLFMKDDIFELARFFNLNLIIQIPKAKFNNKIFNKVFVDLQFVAGDIIVKKFILSSSSNKLEIKGKILKFGKDKLFFYKSKFSTNNYEKIIKNLSINKEIQNNIVDQNIFSVISSGYLNLNKAKIYIEQNETNYFTSTDPYVDKQITYKGNKLEDLNKRFNEKILEGKLINFFNLPKFFELY